MNEIAERMSLEKNIILQLVREKKKNTRLKIESLVRNDSGRILSFSPYELYCRTNVKYDMEVRWKYSHLSSAIHKIEDDERNILAKKIKKIIPFNGILEFLGFREILQGYVYCKCFCAERNLPFLSKQKYAHICRLIRKWQLLSQEIHYRPSKQEKRKLKKLAQE